MDRWAKCKLIAVIAVALVVSGGPSRLNAAPDVDVDDNGIWSQQIAEADGTTGQDPNSGTGVKTAHIQDGAVNPDKISFYGKTVIVAPTGGDFSDPVAALAAISPSASNPFLVKLMPGVYAVTSPVIMKQYVDLEGSGEAVTKIVGSVNGTAGVVYATGNSEVRFLTVENTGGVAMAVAIGGNSMSLFKATAISSAGANTYGIYGYGGGTRKFSSVTAQAIGTTGTVVGIATSGGGTLEFSDVKSSASGGINNYGMSIGGPSTARNLLNLNGVAFGGTNAIGIYFTGIVVASDTSIRGLTASASNATNAYGVYVHAAVATMDSAKIEASGGTNNYGLYVYYNAIASVRDARIKASGGTSFGLYNHGNSNVYVDHSSIAGGTFSVVTRYCSDAYLSNTKLALGSVAAADVWAGSCTAPAATLSCVNIFLDDYATFPSCAIAPH